ncbi:hypothetical protein H6G89_28130 [Oscillatoria sp. FACHB-1407]|uniref:hypothetical protein n=1 Tax=Oscillatoria sp. FACHB-1407 TaxID=2692847 RepID=UPI001687891E|nr:hypothetical protein [Oscillatoria sp. FACHB-1407]MBD2464876.1 hypothetical protein [Oscillatoria sp. FACHB-1407]
MRIPTLAVCALAAFAAQDWNRQAIAASDASPSPESEPTLKATDVLATEESASDPAQAIALPETFIAESLPPSATMTSTADEMRTTETPAEEPLPIAEDPIDAGRPMIAEGDADERVAADVDQVAIEEFEVLSEALMAQATPARRPVSNGAIDIPVEMPLSQRPSVSTAQAQPTVRVTTPVRVSIEGQELPVPGVLPTSFRFPIRTRIVNNPSITTNTPITDQEFPNPLPRANVGSLEELARYREARTVAINVWAEQVRGCMVGEYPNMVSLRTVRQADGTVTEEQIPVLFNNSRGRIVTNGNGRLVCPV